MVCGIILRKYLFSRIWKHGKSDVNLDAGYMVDRNWVCQILLLLLLLLYNVI